MSLIDDLKYKYGLFRLRKDFRKPDDKAIVCNLRKATKIGIIYNATNKEDLYIIKDFVVELKAFVPDVYALGFVDKNELDDFHIQPLEYFFFCNADLNWYHKPEEDSVKDFAQKEFDILIDFTIKDTLSVRFVLAESLAPFKVGKITNIEPNYYDMMLDIDPDMFEKNTEDEETEDEEDNEFEDKKKESVLLYFIEQVKLYLNMITNERL